MQDIIEVSNIAKIPILLTVKHFYLWREIFTTSFCKISLIRVLRVIETLFLDFLKFLALSFSTKIANLIFGFPLSPRDYLKFRVVKYHSITSKLSNYCQFMKCRQSQFGAKTSNLSISSLCMSLFSYKDTLRNTSALSIF